MNAQHCSVAFLHLHSPYLSQEMVGRSYYLNSQSRDNPPQACPDTHVLGDLDSVRLITLTFPFSLFVPHFPIYTLPSSLNKSLIELRWEREGRKKGRHLPLKQSYNTSAQTHSLFCTMWFKIWSLHSVCLWRWHWPPMSSLKHKAIEEEVSKDMLPRPTLLYPTIQ